MDELDISGDQPALEGSLCEAFLLQEHWYKGALSDPANVTFMQFSGSWHRLYFDHAMIFWRTQSDSPAAFDLPEIDARYPLRDLGKELGLIGKPVVSIRPQLIPDGSEVSIRFGEGPTVTLRSELDVMSVHAV
jgi:hypothetical protein